MKVEFGAWIFGVISVMVVSVVLWILDIFVMSNSSLSLMEWWGVVMLMVTFYSGYQVYNEEN